MNINIVCKYSSFVSWPFFSLFFFFFPFILPFMGKLNTKTFPLGTWKRKTGKNVKKTGIKSFPAASCISPHGVFLRKSNLTERVPSLCDSRRSGGNVHRHERCRMVLSFRNFFSFGLINLKILEKFKSSSGSLL